jgi:hypothetical protein
MATNETVIITETNADQTTTTTVVEVVSPTTDVLTVDAAEAPTTLEEIIEAIIDDEPDATVYTVQEYAVVESDAGLTAEGESESVGETLIGVESVAAAEAPLGGEVAAETFLPADEIAAFGAAGTSFDAATTSFAPAAASTEETSSAEVEANAEQAAADAQTASAAGAQQAADDFVAAGDYAAAAEAREAAEEASWEAGDDSMLHGSDAIDLTNAAESQKDAEYYQKQEAEHAAAGDYEAAREDASNAVYATKDADWNAGGDDHSAQATAEHYQMDDAVWEQNIADDKAQTAADYLADGDVAAAEIYADSAAAHQEQADYHGDLGEHGGQMAVYDSTSVVETGGTYDTGAAGVTDTSAAVDYSSSYDSSSYDTTSSE